MKTAPKLALLAGVVALAAGCATQKPYDYSAFKQHRPKSILVMPPLNTSPDIGAPAAVLSQVTFPPVSYTHLTLPTKA